MKMTKPCSRTFSIFIVPWELALVSMVCMGTGAELASMTAQFGCYCFPTTNIAVARKLFRIVLFVPWARVLKKKSCQRLVGDDQGDKENGWVVGTASHQILRCLPECVIHVGSSWSEARLTPPSICSCLCTTSETKKSCRCRPNLEEKKLNEDHPETKGNVVTPFIFSLIRLLSFPMYSLSNACSVSFTSFFFLDFLLAVRVRLFLVQMVGASMGSLSTVYWFIHERQCVDGELNRTNLVQVTVV
jgi:hypothetical protein